MVEPASLTLPSRHPSPLDPAYAEALRGQLATLLAERSSRVLPLLDLDRARAVAASSGGSSDQGTRAALEQALMLDVWLSRYPIELKL